MSFIDPKNGEIDGMVIPTKKPSFKVPEILIHCLTRSAKLWPGIYWEEVLGWCKENNKNVGLIGAKAELQRQEYNSGGCEEVSR